MLLTRNYPKNIINNAIKKAAAIPRSEALKRVEKSKVSDRPVFTVMHDPRMPSYSNIMKKHWKTMVTTDPQL